MNTAVTSKEAILKSCREVVSEKGLSALNMRAVAQSCQVALGSLYNYFPSKDDLVMATIESVWQDIFRMDHPCQNDLPFPQYVRWIFESIQRGALEYPQFFSSHSIPFALPGKDRARETMERYFSHMKKGMAQALEGDPAVRKNAFGPGFTQGDFIDFVLSNLLMLLVQQKNDCEILLETIRRAIYF